MCPGPVTGQRKNRKIFCESYVNLIPTLLGGTHVNGFRTGLLDSIREFCKFRDILPKGVNIAPEDYLGKYWICSFCET